jgi:predicted nucleic acid-binding protein
MTDAEPEPLLVFDNTCLSAFASAHLMPVLKDLTLGFRVGATEAVRDEFCAGPNNVADIAWVDLLPEQGMNELVALAEYVQALGAGDHDLGEATVFASAQVRGAIAITDDATATKIARRIKEVEVHGSLWLLIKAYRDGKVNEQRAGEIVDALRARGARYPCDGAELFSWARSRNLLD